MCVCVGVCLAQETGNTAAVDETLAKWPANVILLWEPLWVANQNVKGCAFFKNRQGGGATPKNSLFEDLKQGIARFLCCKSYHMSFLFRKCVMAFLKAIFKPGISFSSNSGREHIFFYTFFTNL